MMQSRRDVLKLGAAGAAALAGGFANGSASAEGGDAVDRL